MEVVKDAVSISEMARTLGLSRARFYQLMREGVFPEPTRPGKGKRPFFTREQQEQCIEVRRKNRGVNGQVILFYAMRMSSSVGPTPSRKRRKPSQSNRGGQSDDKTLLGELSHGLSQLGLGDVSNQRIRTALAETFPDGWEDVSQAELLRTVFARINRQNTEDMES